MLRIVARGASWVASTRAPCTFIGSIRLSSTTIDASDMGKASTPNKAGTSAAAPTETTGAAERRQRRTRQSRLSKIVGIVPEPQPVTDWFSTPVAPRRVKIDPSQNKSKREMAFQRLLDAYKEDKPLPVFHIEAGVRACFYREGNLGPMCLWAILKTKDQNLLLPRTVNAVVRVLEQTRDTKSLSTLMSAYADQASLLGENTLVSMILNLARNCHTITQFKLMWNYYQLFVDNHVEKEWELTPRILVEVATACVKFREPDRALSTLQILTDANYEPNPNLCRELLQQCLFSGCNKVLRVLASWHANLFLSRLEHGQLTRMLHIAVSQQDQDLAQVTFQLIANNYQPSIGNYACLARANLLANDLVTAVEVLQEMEIKFSHLRHTPEVIALYDDIQALFEAALTTVEQADDLYLAFADVMQGNPDQKLPITVLDALVWTMGRLKGHQSAFKIFGEYEALFKVQPGVASFNALLRVCALVKDEDMEVHMLTILQTMEATCVPSAETLAIIVTYCMEKGNLRTLDHVIRHIFNNNKSLPGKLWRRVAHYYSLRLTKTAEGGSLDKALASVHLFSAPILAPAEVKELVTAAMVNKRRR